jgi:hypothetical protein
MRPPSCWGYRRARSNDSRRGVRCTGWRRWCTAIRAGHRWQAISTAREARVLELAQGRYAGFNHQHLIEMLAESEGLTMHRTTVRRILLKAGLRSPRTRRSVGHR